MSVEGKRLYAVRCGIYADEYRRMISAEGRLKMGSPYLVCFNSCVAAISRMKDEPSSFAPQDCFSVILDQDDEYGTAIDSFNEMRSNLESPHHSRLGTITPSTMEDTVALQTADMVAYELFKRLDSLRDAEGLLRHPLKTMKSENVVNERYFGADTLTSLKEKIESTPSARDGGLVIIPTS